MLHVHGTYFTCESTLFWWKYSSVARKRLCFCIKALCDDKGMGWLLCPMGMRGGYCRYIVGYCLLALYKVCSDIGLGWSTIGLMCFVTSLLKQNPLRLFSSSGVNVNLKLTVKNGNKIFFRICLIRTTWLQGRGNIHGNLPIATCCYHLWFTDRTDKHTKSIITLIAYTLHLNYWISSNSPTWQYNFFGFRQWYW